MKYDKWIFPLLCSGFFTISAAFPAAGAGLSDWPQLQINNQLPEAASETETEMETETESESESASLTVTGSALSEEELDALFGDLPRYLDLGSFTLNRLNHIPIPQISSDGRLILEDADGKLWQVRCSWETLEEKISAILEQAQGDWSVYVKDLSTEDVISLNEHAMQSASLIKLYIAGAAYEQIEKGLLTETDTITTALHEMITVSDNESANVLVRSFCDDSGEFRTGLAKVNDFISRYGFQNTEQVNGISDPSLWVSDGRVNTTSTADCGRMMELIYDRELVSHYASYRFENLLNNQEVNYKIPAALPEGTHISHKTGEESQTENDAAIIYTPYGDYIFCVMSTDLYDTGTAVDTIHRLTALVYDWFTNPTEEYNPTVESTSSEEG